MSKRPSAQRHGPREKSPSSHAGSTRAPREAVARSTPSWAEAAIRHGLWITLAAAIVTHLIQWLLVRANDPFYAQTVKGFDMHTYWAWAEKIVAGDWLSAEYTYKQPFYYGPLYPYYLAVVFKVFGQSHTVVHALQALWGLFPPMLLYGVARRLFGKGPALATGLLAAFCAPILFYEQLLLMEGLLILIHAGILLTLVRGQSGGRGAWAWAAAAGILSAIACWGRGNFLLAIPLLAATWCVAPLILQWNPTPKTEPATGAEGDGDGEDARTPQDSPVRKSPVTSFGSRRWRWTRGAVCAVAYLIGALAFLAIPLVRNLKVSHKPVLTTSNGPILFYIGNAHDATGIFAYPPSYDALVKKHPSQFDVPWKNELVRDMTANPGAFIRLLFKKTWMFLNSYDVADNVSYYLNQRYSWLTRFSPVYWGTLVPLALLGLFRTRRDWRKQIFLYVYLAGFSLSIILVFVVGRYRLEAVLPLLVWSGVAVAAAAADLRDREWNRAAIQAVIVAAGVGILWPTLSPAVKYNTPGGVPDAMRTGAQLIRPNDYSSNANAYIALNRKAEAKALLHDAVNAHPWYDAVVSRLASLYVEEGNPAVAVPLLENFTRAVGGSFTIRLQLAQAQMRTGKLDAARGNIESVLRVEPNNAQAQAMLAQLTRMK